MDAKETLVKLPLSGSLFVIVLALAFFLCHSHDQKIQADLYTYHGTHLLKIEAPIYEDFYSKRLAIDQSGSEGSLKQFKLARRNKQSSKVSELILADRSFRPYLLENSKLFFTTTEAQRWQKHNEVLSKQLSHLSVYQFGLIPEHFTVAPHFSNLLSYLLVDSYWLNPTSNLILMLCLFILLEPKVRRSRLWAMLFFLGVSHSSLYLLVADSLSPPLMGSNILLYFLFGLALSKYLQVFIRSGRPVTIYLTLAILLFWLLKVGLDIYYDFVYSEQVLGLALAALMGSWLGWPGFHLIAKQDFMTEKPEAGPFRETLSADLRTQYHEALTALTRFNFTYARAKLRELTTAAPNEKQLLESSYHLEKLHPDEGYFWPLLETRIEQAITNQNYPDLLVAFKDIQELASTPEAASQCIGSVYYLQTLIIFLRHNNLDKAEQAFNFMLLSGDKQNSKEACQLIIEHLVSKKLITKQDYYQSLYNRL